MDNRICFAAAFGAMAILRTSGFAQSVGVDLQNDVTAFGRAILDFHDGVLTASNIQELDADGMRVDVLGVTDDHGAIGWRTELENGLIFVPEGASINPVVFGIYEGEPTTSPAGLRRVNDMFQLSASFDSDPNALVGIDILDRNGQVVYSRDNLTAGDIPITPDPPQGTQLSIVTEFLTRDALGDFVCSWVFDFSNTNADSIPFVDIQSGTVVAEGIALVARQMVPDDSMTVVTDAIVTGQALAPFDTRGMTITIAPAPCPADFNGDGAVDTRDVIAFLNSWNDDEHESDCDGNGVIDTGDVICFLNAWVAGC